MANYKTKLHEIKAFVFDVDGVFTDGTVLVTESGDLLRAHNAKDGYAIRSAVLAGYPIGIITGGTSATIPRRFKMLGIEDIYIGSHTKIEALEDFCQKHGLKAQEVLFMGDDIPDLLAMRACGLACCPADAVEEVKQAAAYISPFVGGRGCVRDIVEQVMRLQGKWYQDTGVVSQ
jgi:3-deoxy-D-manno-octulosonate 8-phosphate phosphatase, YrbI family